MSGFIVLSVLVIYFSVLMLVAWLVGRKSIANNQTFFVANRKSNWWLVSIGMIGSSISGISFVSVPGMVGELQFTYLQMVIGFFVGYVVIANVLLPIYYKHQLTSIYSYLKKRFGEHTQRAGAFTFIVARLLSSAIRLYLVTLVLQHFVFEKWHIPFFVNVSMSLIIIWLYTRRSGIKTIIWTDTIQTVCLLLALALILYSLLKGLHFSCNEFFSKILQSNHSTIFDFDWHSKQNFFKQFFSGIFVAIAMTGLDQDMMQKNLTCKNLSQAKRNMYSYGFSFLPLNLIFLLIGACLLMLADVNHLAIPQHADDIVPFFAMNYLGNGVSILFITGIIAATFASSDSALAALTTSFSVDVLDVSKDESALAEKKRKMVHFGFTMLILLFVMVFKYLNNKSLIDLLYTIVSYIYGPLLGMFFFGLFTKYKVKDKLVFLVVIFSPIACFSINSILEKTINYSMGYELLILNGLLSFFGMCLLVILRKKTCI